MMVILSVIYPYIIIEALQLVIIKFSNLSFMVLTRNP